MTLPGIEDEAESHGVASSHAARPALRAGSLEDRCVSAIVAGELYGIPIADVQEIIAARPVTRVFHAPRALEGVMSLRGEILAVLDLAVLLGRAHDVERAAVAEPRIIVVREHGGAKRRAGLRIDALGPVRELEKGFAGLSSPPPTMAASVRPFVRGFLRDPPLCAVLDVASLFDAPTLAELAGREAS